MSLFLGLLCRLYLGPFCSRAISGSEKGTSVMFTTLGWQVCSGFVFVFDNIGLYFFYVLLRDPPTHPIQWYHAPTRVLIPTFIGPRIIVTVEE